MTIENWYSATLRFYLVNRVGGKMRAEDSIFLVKADGFETAFQAFLEVGRQHETTYKNHLDEEIRKRFAAVTTLDVVRAESLHGVEICSTPIFEADPNINFDTPLDPRDSKPTQTI